MKRAKTVPQTALVSLLSTGKRNFSSRMRTAAQALTTAGMPTWAGSGRAQQSIPPDDKSEYWHNDADEKSQRDAIAAAYRVALSGTTPFLSQMAAHEEPGPDGKKLKGGLVTVRQWYHGPLLDERGGEVAGAEDSWSLEEHGHTHGGRTPEDSHGSGVFAIPVDVNNPFGTHERLKKQPDELRDLLKGLGDQWGGVDHLREAVHSAMGEKHLRIVTEAAAHSKDRTATRTIGTVKRKYGDYGEPVK